MADNRPRVNSSTWHRARKVERPKRKSTATIKRVPLAQKIDKKITSPVSGQPKLAEGCMRCDASVLRV